MENKFKVVIPVYNSEKWIHKCIWSLFNQSYENWESVIINDASTDATLDSIKDFMKDIPDDQSYKKKKFRLLDRNVNVGAMANIAYGSNLICDQDEDIIVLLDGDDWLASQDVLEYLNGVYQDKDVWLTYGNYNDVHGAPGLNASLNCPTQEYRNGSTYWATSHLRTYKYKIWKLVKDEDLKGPDGKYFAMAWDMAILYPLIEMCGNSRIRFIEKVLYIYNNDNPINDYKKNVSLQLSTAQYIKKLPKYKEL